MSDIIKAIKFLTAFIKLVLECKEKVGEFNLKEDLPIITDYFGKAIELIAATKSTQSNNQEQQQDNN